MYVKRQRVYVKTYSIWQRFPFLFLSGFNGPGPSATALAGYYKTHCTQLGTSAEESALVVDWKWKMANADVFPLPGPSTRKQRKPVNSKQQNIILNVVNHSVKEKENGGKPLYRSHAIVSKTAAATGFSSTYIRKLAREGKAGRTPGKNRHQKKGKFGKLDEFDLGIIIDFICEISHQQLLKF